MQFEETRDLYNKLEDLKPLFKPGGKFGWAYPLFEANETFLFIPGVTAPRAPHVRDKMDIKRLMSTVVVALMPVILIGMYNVGLQKLGALGQPTPWFACLGHGAWHMLPIVLVSYIVGGVWEVLFAVVRKHEINEGFLVTGMLFPLTCPPDLPLWMVAAGISFGIVIGKEVFGGTGMNVLNPALTARAFVFFAYPAYMSGEVWTAVDPTQVVDGWSGATPLAVAAEAVGPDAVAAIQQSGVSLVQAFMGVIPGSMGEVSTFACLLGAAVLIASGVGSWKIMFSMLLGGIGGSFFINAVAGPTSSGIMSLPWMWQLCLGGFAFGLVFMATDPVSAAATHTGKWIYGFLTGFLAILVRTVNPAYPEGVMLAILFMNVFAPLIDHFVVRANMRRRLARV
jgi:Na+-transporting NADH:ubiquinone oxidoreductase subunit B